MISIFPGRPRAWKSIASSSENLMLLSLNGWLPRGAL
jgi:hypothetical protein